MPTIAERACAGCLADISRRPKKTRWCSSECRCRSWRRANPDKMSASVLAWKKKNPDANRAAARSAYSRNPETAKRAARDRRAREIGAESCSITERDWRRLVLQYRGACAHCGAIKKLTRDHVIPLNRGGRHSIGNLVPSCGPCNSGRKDRLLIEWRGRGRRY